MASEQQDRPDNLIKRLEEEIIPLLKEGLSCNSAFYSNPGIITCRESLGCKTPDCSHYGKSADAEPCWQSAEECCNGKPEGSFITTHNRCYDCKVFKDSCPTIVEEISEHVQNTARLLDEKNSRIEEYGQQIKSMQEDLNTALEQLRKREIEIQEIMITDKLTTLFNRQHLITVLEEEIARCQRYGRPIALMMIDIDGFRSFNDSYGHQAGDMMLSFIGTLIKENTRKFDRAFRYGGEEFIIVLPESDLTMAYIVAERIRKGFESRPIPLTGQESGKHENISHSVSIGLTATFAFGTQDVSIEYLIAQTEESLLQAKEKGGNMCIRHN
jgi:diguanylate cyclase (GGDEF)-like protein